FKAVAEDSLAVCGLTLFHERENPLRRERRTLYCFTLPSAAGEEKDRFKVEVDLGTVTNTYVLGPFEREPWIASEAAGLGERIKPIRGAARLYAEVAASQHATLTLTDTNTATRYDFDLSRVVQGQPLAARQNSAAQVEVLEREKTWIRGRVLDSAT